MAFRMYPLISLHPHKGNRIHLKYMYSLLIRITVLVLALSQPVFAYLSTIGKSSSLIETTLTDPIITPAEYAFSIWAVITFGSVCYGIYQVLPTRRNSALYDKIAPYTIATFIGFSAWLYAAQQDWLFTTVAILTVMNIFLWKSLFDISRVSQQKRLSLSEEVIVHGSLGLYAGWTTIAVFANLASTLALRGFVSPLEIGWQALVLVVTLITALWGIRVMKYSFTYILAILWAFISITIGSIQNDLSSTLIYIPLVATLLIGGTLYKSSIFTSAKHIKTSRS